MRRWIIVGLLLLIGATGMTVRAVVPGTNGRIAFASDRTGTLEIFTMEPNGSGLRQVTPAGDVVAGGGATPVSDREPAWSPDGRRIAFRSNRSGNNDVWVMNADGTGAVNLTNNPAAEGEMSWSPDGSRIVFRRDVPVDGEQLFVMNAAGSGQTRLTTTGQSFRPDWSPNGTRIVFAGDRGAGEQILVMNADGSGETALTSPGGGQFDPAWSPDASRIAFARESAVFAGDAEIVVMTATGANPQSITPGPENHYYPAWSPDGTRIVFARTPPGVSGNADTAGEILVMTPTGGGVTNLTNDAGHDTDPDWQRVTATAPPSASMTPTPTPTPTPTATPSPSPSIVTPAPGNGDVAITLSSNKARVRRGQLVGFTAIVRNSGSIVASGVEVDVIVPARLSFVSVTGSGCTAPAPGGSLVSCVIGPLPPRNSTTIVVEMRGRKAGTAEVLAEALTSASGDLTPNDNRVVERVRVTDRRRR